MCKCYYQVQNIQTYQIIEKPNSKHKTKFLYMRFQKDLDVTQP